MSEAKRDDTGIALDLEAEKERYERFFENYGPAVIDVQATNANTAHVKAMADIHKKTDPKASVYAMSPVVMGEFVTFIKAAKTLDKAFVNQLFGLIDRFFDKIKPQ